MFKWTSSSWCEDQDFYRFSGIYRDVYLYTVPDVHIRDLRIRAIPDETLTRGTLKSAQKPGDREKPWSACPKTAGPLKESMILDKGGLTMEIENPAMWSAEEPQLYDLTIQIYDQDGNIQDISRNGWDSADLK